MNIRQCIWKTRTGKNRRIRLYKSYMNMLDRIAGRNHAGNGATPWKGLENGFRDFAHFRTWALKNGYSKLNCSLDRVQEHLGYIPSNLRFVTRADNTRFRNYKRGHNIVESYTAPVPF